MDAIYAFGRSSYCSRVLSWITTAMVAVVPVRVLSDALVGAAGGAGGGGGGFDQVAKYINTVTTYVLVIGGPLAFLALVAAAMMLMTGNPDARRIGFGAVIGVGIMLAAKAVSA